MLFAKTRNAEAFCALRAGLFLGKGGIDLLFVEFMDRKHSLTTRFVSMVSVMNIHGRRIVRPVRIDAPPSGLSGVR